MDEGHDDGNRGAPAVCGFATFTIPFAMFSKDSAEIIDILWLLRRTTDE
jgi:hypothetical protein